MGCGQWALSKKSRTPVGPGDSRGNELGARGIQESTVSIPSKLDILSFHTRRSMYLNIMYI